MASVNGLAETFDGASSLYDKMRPGYADELYQAIFAYVAIGAASRVAEVGSGSGQATKPLLDRGCSLTAIEYGEHLSALLKEKYRGYDGFEVITGRFEDVEAEENAYDLVFSATAFHWIPEETGYRKVYSMLRSGGAFARFANHPFPCRDNKALAADIERLYDEYYSPYYNRERSAVAEYLQAEAEAVAKIAGRHGFEDIRCFLFRRERVFTADEYVKLLGTYSDHIAIEKAVREKFFSGIREAINAHGGRLTISDTMDLQLARKP